MGKRQGSSWYVKHEGVCRLVELGLPMVVGVELVEVCLVVDATVVVWVDSGDAEDIGDSGDSGDAEDLGDSGVLMLAIDDIRLVWLIDIGVVSW